MQKNTGHIAYFTTATKQSARYSTFYEITIDGHIKSINSTKTSIRIIN